MEFNVRLKPSECYFGRAHIEFLGHDFSETGMQLSDERVRGIRQITEPTSLKKVSSFIGMANYFRDSINELSGHLIALTMLTKKRYSSEKLIFSKSFKISFEKLKTFWWKGRN